MGIWLKIWEQLSKELIDDKGERSGVMDLLGGMPKGIDVSPLINHLVRDGMTVPVELVPSTSRSPMLSDPSNKAIRELRMKVDVDELFALTKQDDLQAQLPEEIIFLDTTNALKRIQSSSLRELDSSIKESQRMIDDILERLKNSVRDLADCYEQKLLFEPEEAQKALDTIEISLAAFPTYIKRYIQAVERRIAMSEKEISLALVLTPKSAEPAAKPAPPPSTLRKRPSSPPEAQPAAKRRKGKKSVRFS
ncbi:hypothetical protein FRC14_001691 [Serendipita sp. 396]|nr:hypothetical protein FRC14_001691 [Serendipita sp. 396]KAG8870896.1 hypothetical protein FRC20_011185 [Serendipita sp. 405]